MSCPDQQNLAEAVIDGLRFAARQECITGRIAVARMLRLADVLEDTGGWLRVDLAGIPSFGGIHAERSGLHLRVSGQLKLKCQRCLSDVDVDCAIDNRLMLVETADQDAWPDDEFEADAFDAIPASRELSVLSLVEEEVLLSLPLVPRHAECELLIDHEANGEPAEQENVSSPFAVLADLKKH